MIAEEHKRFSVRLRVFLGIAIVTVLGLFICFPHKPENQVTAGGQNPDQIPTNAALYESQGLSRALSRPTAVPKRGTSQVRRELINELSRAVAEKDTVLLKATVDKIRADIDETVPELSVLLKNGQRDAKETAAMLLAEQGSRAAVTAILDEYRTTDDDVLRSNLEQTILKIRSDESIQVFINYFEPTAPGDLRKLAELVLADNGTPRAIEELDRFYDSTEDISAHRSIGIVMRNLHNPEGAPFLAQKLAIRIQSREKLEIYADALKSIGTQQAIGVLQSLARDSDPVRQAVGREALGK